MEKDDINKEQKEKLFDEMDSHLLHDERPSEFFNNVLQKSRLVQDPFCLLAELVKTKQSPKHHPEGSVWNHTMMVIDEAAYVKNKSGDANVFMWAALLHDIGKPVTSRNKNGKITAYNHDKAGAELARKFLAPFVRDAGFVEKVAMLVRWHMQVLFVVNGLPFQDLANMKRQTDIKQIALLSLCDRLGRLGANRDEERRKIDLFYKLVLG